MKPIHVCIALILSLSVIYGIRWLFYEDLEKAVVVERHERITIPYQSEVQRCEGCALEMETFYSVTPNGGTVQSLRDSALYGWNGFSHELGEIIYLSRFDRYMYKRNE